MMTTVFSVASYLIKSINNPSLLKLNLLKNEQNTRLTPNLDEE